MTDSPTFFLDNKTIPFQEGDNLLMAAHRANHYIPHLCFHPELKANGSCKICIVSVNGRVTSACTEPATQGLQVTSETPSLKDTRLKLIQLLFAEGNHFCPSCEVSGNCQLQAIAYDLGMTHYQYNPFYPVRREDGSHPEVFVDQDRCIFCNLCSRASQDIDHKSCFGLGGRGKDTYLFFSSNTHQLKDTTVEADDKSMHICPVGCLLPKTGNYQSPIGSRLYDHQSIHLIGNHRNDEPQQEE